MKLTVTRLATPKRTSFYWFNSPSQLILFVSALEDFQKQDAARGKFYQLHYQIHVVDAAQ